MLWNVAAGLFAATILLRLGFLAFVAMLLVAGLLRGPVTLDLNAWTLGTTARRGCIFFVSRALDPHVT